MKKFYILAASITTFIFADNQTSTLSPVYLTWLPNFLIKIEKDTLELPIGIQSGAVGVSGNKWLFIGGRKNGLHGFNDDDFNFPANQQNDVLIVVDRDTNIVTTRTLIPGSVDISQELFDSLTVTNSQHYQEGDFLYMVGGYGWDVAANDFITQSLLTSINVPNLIAWVESGTDSLMLNTIRQISDSTFQVAGGEMKKLPGNPTLLILGQNFTGAYRDSSNGVYTRQIRRFNINDDGTNLSATILPSIPSVPDENYRRRDLNVASITRKINGVLTHSFNSFSVFFTTTDGVWTVPINITADGIPSMDDPASPDTFKQGINIYASTTIGLFSEKNNDMNTIILGGLTFQYTDNGTIASDPGLPFTNQVAAINLNENGEYKQYILNSQFPTIQSTGTNPGKTLLFGAESLFIPDASVITYPNGVINSDKIIGQSTVVGYLVGGIMSTVPDTNTMAESAASPYIFKITIHPYAPLTKLVKALVDKYNS